MYIQEAKARYRAVAPYKKKEEERTKTASLKRRCISTRLHGVTSRDRHLYSDCHDKLKSQSNEAYCPIEGVQCLSSRKYSVLDDRSYSRITSTKSPSFCMTTYSSSLTNPHGPPT
jgi:hypothetical protein